jgi:hypothetical protein
METDPIATEDTSPMAKFNALFAEERVRLYLRLSLEASTQGILDVATKYIRTGLVVSFAF